MAVRNVGGEPLRSTASNNSSRSTSINNDEQQKDPTGKTYTDISVDSNAMGESPARMGWSGNSTLCVIVGTHLDEYVVFTSSSCLVVLSSVYVWIVLLLL